MFSGVEGMFPKLLSAMGMSVLDYSTSTSWMKELDIKVEKVLAQENVEEVNKLAFLSSGEYLSCDWNNKVNVDFYVVKGMLENLLSYLGLIKRYKLDTSKVLKDMHPYMSASILVDNVNIDYGTKEFADATISSFAQAQALSASYALISTALDLIESDFLLSEVKETFNMSKENLY